MMTFEQHRQAGEVLKQATRIPFVKGRAENMRRYKIHKGLSLLRCELDSLLFREHLDLATTRVYYGTDYTRPPLPQYRDFADLANWVATLEVTLYVHYELPGDISARALRGLGSAVAEILKLE